MPRETWMAPATLPLCSTSGPSRTSTTSAFPPAIISRASDGVTRGTAALAASSICLTPVVISPSFILHNYRDSVFGTRSTSAGFERARLHPAIREIGVERGRVPGAVGERHIGIGPEKVERVAGEPCRLMGGCPVEGMQRQAAAGAPGRELGAGRAVDMD